VTAKKFEKISGKITTTLYAYINKAVI